MFDKIKLRPFSLLNIPLTLISYQLIERKQLLTLNMSVRSPYRLPEANMTCYINTTMTNPIQPCLHTPHHNTKGLMPQNVLNMHVYGSCSRLQAITNLLLVISAKRTGLRFNFFVLISLPVLLSSPVLIRHLFLNWVVSILSTTQTNLHGNWQKYSVNHI